MKERDIKEIARFVIKTGATVRQAAKMFGVSRCSIYKDITKRLQKIDLELYEKVRTVLDKNKAERHIRGGASTKEKYRSLKKEN